MKTGGNDAVVLAEYRLLNTLASNREYRQDSRVHEDVFVHEIAKSVYQALERLDQQEIPITKNSLYQCANEIDYAVNKSVIEAIYSIQEDVEKLDDILNTLHGAVKKKNIQGALHKLLAITNMGGKLAEEDILQGLFEVDNILKTGANTSILKSFSDWSDEYIEELRERAKGRRYLYGDDNLDNCIYKGAYPGAITTIAAGTGQGKSTYVLNLISNLIDLYIPCMYVTLEMSSIDTYDRLIANRADVPMEALYTYDDGLMGIIKLVEAEKKQLESNHNFYVVDEPNLSVARLRALIKEFKQRTKKDYAIIVVDLVTQLQDFMHGKAGQSVANSMETAMNDLNSLAKEQNVHFIAVVQFNRDADNYKVNSIEDLDLLRPTLNNIKNSHAIAERSRVVISLFRKKFYADRYLHHIPEAETMEDILELNILKNSNGAVGVVSNYLFDGAYFRVLPIKEGDIQSAASLDLDY